MRLRVAASMIAALALSLAWADAAAAACDAPQASLTIASAPSLPQSAAAFAGVWRGSWPVAVRGHVVSQCARLNIAVTGAQEAGVEQCTGSVAAAKRKPACKKYAARINGNELSFTDLDGSAYSFTLADVGGMLGKRVNAAHRSVTNFSRGE